MNIKKITLSQGGFRGLTVTYLREEEKNGRPFINEVTEKRKHPIHLSLETMFKDLRFYLLDITGMLRGDEDKTIKDFTIQETDVTAIEFNNEMFCISGEKSVFADKKFKVKTPKVDDNDQYEHYETVLKMIESIKEEVKEYLAGTKKVDDVEVAVRWVEAGKSKDMTPEQLKGMSPEQLKEFAVKLLESNFGAVVMMNDDFEPTEEATNEAVQDIVNEITISDEETTIIIPEQKEEKKEKAWKKNLKKKEEEVVKLTINSDPITTEEALKVIQAEQKPAF